MKCKKAEKEFRKRLRSSGHGDIPRPQDGIPLMLAFYRDVRAVDADLSSDGDMLLFQWGMYDWGAGPRFEVDITRQLIRGPGEDDDIWQLHLTYRCTSSDELNGLGKGNRWCHSPDELPAFETFVLSHPAVLALRSLEGAVEISYERAG